MDEPEVIRPIARGIGRREREREREEEDRGVGRRRKTETIVQSMVIASHAGSIVELWNRLAKVLECLDMRTIGIAESKETKRVASVKVSDVW